MALRIIPSSLIYFPNAALEGAGEKVRGNEQQNAEGIRMHTPLIHLQHSEKQAAFTTH